MDCPAISSDLNPMANLWGILSQQVYSAERQFHYARELESSLIEFMPRRINTIILANGNHTNY